ncbi:MAG: hypothetical protein ABL907_15200 [Hyphomicrobium sp.]
MGFQNMQAWKRRAAAGMMAAGVMTAGVTGAWAVAELNYDELISVVFFEDEGAYKDPTGYFCRFIALVDKDDYCKATMVYIEPKLCKVEVTRELRATYGDGKGREFLKSKDVFTLANLDLTTLPEPEVDYEHKTSRQTFHSGIDVKWHEGYQYTFALDAKGAYKACLVNGAEKEMTEAECVTAGAQPYAGTRKVSLLFNTENYNRSMAAIRWLQKTYCPKGEAL